MKPIITILTTALARFDEMMDSAVGWALTATITLLNFFAGYKIALLVVLIAIILDMIWGIAAARKRGQFACSELARDTFSKISAYGTALVLTILIENLITGSHTIGNDDSTQMRWAVDIVAGIITAVEAWSICGNILIVRPNLPFFRLIRNPLVGEIARKLNIPEDEVKEYLENRSKKNKNTSNNENNENNNNNANNS